MTRRMKMRSIDLQIAVDSALSHPDYKSMSSDDKLMFGFAIVYNVLREHSESFDCVLKDFKSFVGKYIPEWDESSNYE
jgi:hypothetical protein